MFKVTFELSVDKLADLHDILIELVELDDRDDVETYYVLLNSIERALGKDISEIDEVDFDEEDE